MAKGDRRSRDQKRQAKLKKRAARTNRRESLAYHGSKYRTDEYAKVIHRTEVGIYETHVISDRLLTDDEVEESLGRIILAMRRGPLPPPTAEPALPPDEDEDESEEAEDFLTWNLRRNWQILAESGELPGPEDLIGVLRTLLHSLEFWRSKNMHPQGYLRYIEGFLKETGVRVERVSPSSPPLAEPQGPAPPALGSRG